MPTYYSYATVRKVDNDTATNKPAAAHSQYLLAMERHGKGIGETADERRIEGAKHRAYATAMGADGKPLRWKHCKHGEDAPQLHLRQAWRNHMKANNAGLRANGRMAEHLIIGVTPEWLEADGGSRRDLSNPRVKAMILEAVKWTNRELGGVFAVRYDLDEAGCAVDIFYAPIREQGRKDSRRPFVAVAQAHSELAKREGKIKSYEAMQDSWHRHCVQHLGPDITRGESKAITGRSHVGVDTYKARQDGVSEAAAAEVERKRDEAESLDAAAEAKRGELAAIEAHLAELRTKRRRWLKRATDEVARNKVVNRAIRHAAQTLRSMADVGETGPEFTSDLIALAHDANATMDGDADALRRLTARFGDEALAARKRDRGQGRV